MKSNPKSLLVKILILFVVIVACENEMDLNPTIRSEISTDYLMNGNLTLLYESDSVFRLQGKPGTTLINLGLDVSKYEDCFILHVKNGSNGSKLVSSANIKLDGEVLVRPSDFGKKAEFKFEICNLSRTSVIEVEVKGKPGSYINIWLEGKRKFPTDGLIAFYPFSGNTEDESGNGNDGINYGATFSFDRFNEENKSLYFNGRDNYVRIPTSASFQSIISEITISAWIKKGMTSIQDQFIISRRNQTNPGIHFAMEVNPSYNLMFLTGGVNTPHPGYTILYTQDNCYDILNDGNWHNVIAVHKYGTGRLSALYVDGVLFRNNWLFIGPDYPVNIPNEDVFIGKQNIYPSELFSNSFLDDIRVYNRALTSDEIAMLAN